MIAIPQVVLSPLIGFLASDLKISASVTKIKRNKKRKFMVSLAPKVFLLYVLGVNVCGQYKSVCMCVCVCVCLYMYVFVDEEGIIFTIINFSPR